MMRTPTEPEKILLLEDSILLAKTLKREIERRAVYQVDTAGTLQQAKELLQRQRTRYALAVLDLTLPDATQEEIVAFFQGAGLPSIVMTSTFDEQQREYVFSQGVIDFILKDGPTSLEYLFSLLDRLHRNRDVEILLVDDSRSAREQMGRLLRKHHFQVHQAAGGTEALAVLAAHPEIRLIVTDYNMPGMDGCELTRQVRQQRSQDHLGILGVSAHGTAPLSARFLKAGANDFLRKPFLEEEFTCRVTRNVENLERIRALEDVAIRDFLTGLHNRRFLWDVGTRLFAGLRAGRHTLCAAVLDVDFFKKINDLHGHDAGDAVLRTLGGLLSRTFAGTDVVARIGGEEFCVLLVNRTRPALEALFEQLRHAIQTTVIVYNDVTIPVTASIGLSTQPADTLTDLINQADAALYRAKQHGRNRVVFHDPAGTDLSAPDGSPDRLPGG
ncbi:MAG: diguanylate cyclase [Magnetococcus sp. DMHC-8]